MPRLSFSQRMGLTPTEFPLQVDSLDDATRMDIFNAIVKVILSAVKRTNFQFMEGIQKRICIYIWADVLRMDLSKLSQRSQVEVEVRELILNRETKWYSILDFCEELIQIQENIFQKFSKELDIVLERNNVGFRVIGGKICPITDGQEIKSIKKALELPDRFSGARNHIATALKLLSDREKPDYRNSIKESISAVESVCMVLVGDSSASLGKALKHLEDNGIKIHPSLKSGFSSIYGYTSDEGGIRHAMIEEGAVVTQEDALFMLVSCSAFCHYLEQKATQTGILL